MIRDDDNLDIETRPVLQGAYIKQVDQEGMKRMFPDAPPVPPHVKLFALVLESGEPIMITDSREAALANAWSNNLETLTLH